MEFLHWRILVTDANSDYSAIAEIQMALTPGGANQCVGGTVTGEGQIGPDYGPAIAYDGISQTSDPYWVADLSPLPWAAYHFPSAKDIREVRIKIANQNATHSPKAFKVQYSVDGATWATALTVAGQTGWVLSETRTYAVPEAVLTTKRRPSLHQRGSVRGNSYKR